MITKADNALNISQSMLQDFSPSEIESPHSTDRYLRAEQLLGVDACRQLGLYPVPDDFLLTVVIPVYNELETIHELVQRVRSVPLPKEIILIDDCSQDGTRDALKSYENAGDVRVILHDKNRGKGAAVRTGFAHVRGSVVIVQDADLEYDPAEYPRLIQPIVEGKADAVFGSRFLGYGPHRVLYFWHYLGNMFLTTLSNMFTNLNLTDMETCYKVIRADLLRKISPTLKQDRFGIEPEITAKLSRQKVRIFEIAISYSGRTYQEGKKIGWKDGVQALWCIVRYGLGE